ncbi:MAG: hypothetical protein Q7T32_03890 [Moraxellaceae bacterium]|nr:hypothetical protein [Moraxellaceae bacterium]
MKNSLLFYSLIGLFSLPSVSSSEQVNPASEVQRGLLPISVGMKDFLKSCDWPKVTKCQGKHHIKKATHVIKRTDDIDSIVVFELEFKGMSFQYRSPSKQPKQIEITGILVTSSDWQLPYGLRVGDKGTKIISAIGPPAEMAYKTSAKNRSDIFYTYHDNVVGDLSNLVMDIAGGHIVKVEWLPYSD